MSKPMAFVSPLQRQESCRLVREMRRLCLLFYLLLLWCHFSPSPCFPCSLFVSGAPGAIQILLTLSGATLSKRRSSAKFSFQSAAFSALCLLFASLFCAGVSRLFMSPLEPFSCQPLGIVIILYPSCLNRNR